MRRLVAGIWSERQLWLVYALLGITMVESALVIWGNLPRTSAWLLMLLALGIGQGLLLPTAAGSLGGLAVAAFWVLFRQGAGIWQRTDLVQSLLELTGLGVSLALAIYYRRAWALDRKHFRSLQPLRTLVADDEGSPGLVSFQVAGMRLQVEMERARAFGHPLGVVLFEATPRPGLDLAEADLQQVYRAVARQVGNEIESYDTPFADGPNRAGAIMPERDSDQLSHEAVAIVHSLVNTIYIDSQGMPKPVSDAVRLDCGLATYRGEAAVSRDLMLAAERCLSTSRARPEEGAWCCSDVVEVPVIQAQEPSAPLPEGG